MIVCNSETIREALRDATLKHDFRFLDPRVIVELFYALRNETSAGGVDTKARSANIILRERMKYLMLLRKFSRKYYWV